ncbi:hypothetical protein [Prosthecobacter sp.]|uniref:hypothetical protein n=1 Tax=Prosthecobacter sp. TaxID=1965333 RepID=UPI002AB8B3F4|nr:hypothetical protein [Prosthecobacter sp.]MDZ4405277.1 hypothetical protein [Prosthecobacter sp.]
MKYIRQLLALGSMMMVLPSCDTYVEGRGHAHRPSWGHGHNHSSHYDRGPSRRSGPSINANTNIGAGLRL